MKTLLCLWLPLLLRRCYMMPSSMFGQQQKGVEGICQPFHKGKNIAILLQNK